MSTAGRFNTWWLGLCERSVFVSLSFALLVGAEVLAHEPASTYDRVNLTASVEQEVENDLLIATLFAEHQAQRQITVSNHVNQAISWALEKAKQANAVKVQTTQYNTNPIYKKTTISGWRARQSIRLESRDVDAMSELIGVLQERLAIGSVNYSVSKTQRDTVEDVLIAQAINQFRQRASLVAQELGRANYRIVQMNVNSQGGRPMSVAYSSRAQALESVSSAPAIEAGVQTVGVTINGTIELDAAQ